MKPVFGIGLVVGLASLLLTGRAVAMAEPLPPPPVPILLDTDIGDDVDDAFALALILASPELELRGVTTVFGDAHSRALVVCRFLEAAGRAAIPVAAGSPVRDKPERRGQLSYGLDGTLRKRPGAEPAVEFLYRRLKEKPGELTVLALGPLTNVAELLRRHPDCKPWVKRVVLMGGSVRVGYNGRPPAEPEWNIKSDVAAAQTVFASGVPLTVAPLDATTDLKLEQPERELIFQRAGALGRELQALCRLYDKPTPILFDPVAVTLSFDERLARLENLRLDVDARGLTRAVPGKPSARVAVSLERDAFLKWYVARLTAPR